MVRPNAPANPELPITSSHQVAQEKFDFVFFGVDALNKGSL